MVRTSIVIEEYATRIIRQKKRLQNTEHQKEIITIWFLLYTKIEKNVIQWGYTTILLDHLERHPIEWAETLEKTVTNDVDI